MFSAPPFIQNQTPRLSYFANTSDRPFYSDPPTIRDLRVGSYSNCSHYNSRPLSLGLFTLLASLLFSHHPKSRLLDCFGSLLNYKFVAFDWHMSHVPLVFDDFCAIFNFSACSNRANQMGANFDRICNLRLASYRTIRKCRYWHRGTLGAVIKNYKLTNKHNVLVWRITMLKFTKISFCLRFTRNLKS